LFGPDSLIWPRGDGTKWLHLGPIRMPGSDGLIWPHLDMPGSAPIVHKPAGSPFGDPRPVTDPVAVTVMTLG